MKSRNSKLYNMALMMGAMASLSFEQKTTSSVKEALSMDVNHMGEFNQSRKPSKPKCFKMKKSLKAKVYPYSKKK